VITFNLFDVEDHVMTTELVDFLQVTSFLELADVQNVGSVAMEYTSSGNTQVEIRFGYVYLHQLYEKFEVSEAFYDKSNDFKGGSEINYAIITQDQEGQFYSYPDSFRYYTEPSGTVFNQLWFENYLDTPFNLEYNAPPLFSVDIGIHHIELIQATQTEGNTMPLVMHKPTLARVFIYNPLEYSKLITVKLTGFGCVGISCLYNQPCEANPEEFEMINLGTIQKDWFAPGTLSFSREDIHDSTNFILPASWLNYSVLILTAEVSLRGGAWADPFEFNNIKSTRHFFYPTHDMNIFYCRLKDERSIRVSESYVDNVIGNLSIVFPMANPNFIELDWSAFGHFDGDESDLLLELEAYAFDLMLLWFFLAALGLDPPFPIPDMMFGFLYNALGRAYPCGWGRIPGAGIAACAGENLLALEMIMAHEINHNLGPFEGVEQWGFHVDGDCSESLLDEMWLSLYSDGEIHEPGWYPGATEMIPSTCPEFMTYCRSGYYPTTWISDYRWPRLFEKLYYFESGSPCTPTSLTKDSSGGSIRLIQGYFTNETDGMLKPSVLYTMPSYDKEQLPNYDMVFAIDNPLAYLEVSFLNGSTLSIPLASDFITHDGISTDKQIFTFLLPDDGEITKLRLRDLGDVTLDEKQGTGFYVNSSQINNPGTIHRDTPTEVSWDLFLDNQSNIYTKLQYSPDGLSWFPLGPFTLGDTLNVTFTTLPGGQNAQFRLLLTDGFETQFVNGTTFSLSNLAPEIEIVQTHPEQLVRGSRLSLQANGRDPETGELANSSYIWNIFRNGVFLFTTFGDKLDTRFTETGIYSAQLVAIDPSGANS